TDPSIVSVVALFPFGLTKPLRHLEKEDIWQTRFLAPLEMEDGTHTVRLVMRDRNGGIYRESKTFIIASKRTLLAQREGTPPVRLRGNPDEAASTGELMVPEERAPGSYRLTVTAED